MKSAMADASFTSSTGKGVSTAASVATDAAIDTALPILDVNDPAAIADFILDYDMQSFIP